jgi:hypothetical protein
MGRLTGASSRAGRAPTPVRAAEASPSSPRAWETGSRPSPRDGSTPHGGRSGVPSGDVRRGSGQFRVSTRVEGTEATADSATAARDLDRDRLALRAFGNSSQPVLSPVIENEGDGLSQAPPSFVLRTSGSTWFRSPPRRPPPARQPVRPSPPVARGGEGLPQEARKASRMDAVERSGTRWFVPSVTRAQRAEPPFPTSPAGDGRTHTRAVRRSSATDTRSHLA